MQSTDPSSETLGRLVQVDEDMVPVVIISRYRLAERVVQPYGLDAFLVVDEAETSSMSRYSIICRTHCNTISVPWVIHNPRRFHDGLVALHKILELNFPLGFTLGELLVQGELERPGVNNSSAINSEIE